MPRPFGNALISALLLMALMSTVTVAMMHELQMHIHRVQWAINRDELYLASQAVTFWAMDTVSDPNRAFYGLNEEGQIESYPKDFAHLYPHLSIQGKLYDLQARFNLNTAEDSNYRFVYMVLLHTLFKKNSALLNYHLTTQLIEWISPSNHGITDSPYAKAHPAYQASHVFMQSPSELQLIYGMTTPMVETMMPYVTTLPTPTPININTASKVVLRALSPKITSMQLDILYSKREEQPFTQINEALPLLKEVNIPMQIITVKSQYFLSVAEVSSEDGEHLTQYSVLKRGLNRKGAAEVKIVYESVNVL